MCFLFLMRYFQNSFIFVHLLYYNLICKGIDANSYDGKNTIFFQIFFHLYYVLFCLMIDKFNAVAVNLD